MSISIIPICIQCVESRGNGIDYHKFDYKEGHYKDEDERREWKEKQHTDYHRFHQQGKSM